MSVGETGAGIGEVLTHPMLERLAERGGACVLYTHLGKLGLNGRHFPATAIAGLRRLSEAQDRGDVLTTTTRRLLDYSRAVGSLNVTQVGIGERTRIEATCHGALPALAGLTFYCSDPARVELVVNGREIENLQRNAPDDTGRLSVSIPWNRLCYPA